MTADAAEIVRLADKIRSRVVAGPNGCWKWTGATNGGGYGQVWNPATKRKMPTHRATYMGAGGVIPPGYHIDHLCRNPACCNPAHLEAVTPRENTRRGDAGLHYKLTCEAITHCANGHLYTPDNTYICKRGRRQCRACWPTAGKRGRARISAAKEWLTGAQKKALRAMSRTEWAVASDVGTSGRAASLLCALSPPLLERRWTEWPGDWRAGIKVGGAYEYRLTEDGARAQYDQGEG